MQKRKGWMELFRHTLQNAKFFCNHSFEIFYLPLNCNILSLHPALSSSSLQRKSSYKDINVNWIYRDAGLSAELRALAMVFGSDPKNDDDFKFLWKTYVDTPLDAERRYIMKAFSRVKDKKKLKMYVYSILLKMMKLISESCCKK